MSDELQGASPNGANVFAIGDLLNLIVPFEFPFEGQKLKGKWCKFKTATRNYQKNKTDERIAQVERWGELQREIASLQPDDPRVDDLIAQCDALEEAAQRTNTSWLIDAIVEWNAIGLDRQPIPLTPAGLIDVPIPFLDAFAQFLIDSRTDKNPTLAGS